MAPESTPTVIIPNDVDDAQFDRLTTALEAAGFELEPRVGFHADRAQAFAAVADQPLADSDTAGAPSPDEPRIVVTAEYATAYPAAPFDDKGQAHEQLMEDIYRGDVEPTVTAEQVGPSTAGQEDDE